MYKGNRSVQIQVNYQYGDNENWKAIGSGIAIHPNWVLTAAHVVDGGMPTRIAIRVDQHEKLLIDTCEVIIHSDYDIEKSCFDMAVLKLVDPLDEAYVTPFIENFYRLNTRWQHQHASLTFQGLKGADLKPYSYQFSLEEPNEEEKESRFILYANDAETPRDYIGFQIPGGLADGCSGGPCLFTAQDNVQYCVGMIVEGGSMEGPAAGDSLILGGDIILPWLKSTTFSKKAIPYYSVDGKDPNLFSVFKWVKNVSYQTLLKKDKVTDLLKWDTAISRLIGRDEALAELNQWFEKNKASSVCRVYYGEGGVGKTRFVKEWAEHYFRDHDWQIADGKVDQLDTIHQAIEKTPSPWLIIIDDPEPQGDKERANLLDSMQSWYRAGRKVVVILVSRYGKDYWEDLWPGKFNESCTIDYRELQPILPNDSYQLLSETLTQLGQPKESVRRDEYLAWMDEKPTERRYMRYPLMVLGQAICMAKNPELSFKSLKQREIITALYDYEDSRLTLKENAVDRGNGLTRGERGLSFRLSMLATLIGPLSKEVLEAAAEDQDKSMKLIGLPSARDMGSLLGATGLDLLSSNYISPLQPDIFGAGFALETFNCQLKLKGCEDFQKHLSQWFAFFLDKSENMNACLDRFGQRYHDLVHLNLQPKQLYAAFREAFTLNPTLLSKAEPYFATARALLPELGVTVYEHLVSIYQEKIKENYSAHAPTYAQYLNNLAVRLDEGGEREKSLQAINEAVDIRKHLAKEDFNQYGLDLANSLTNLSLYSKLQHPKDSIKAIQEAVDIYRQFADQDFPKYGLWLANGLNRLSSALADVGYRNDGLQASKEAVEVYRDILDCEHAQRNEFDFASILNGLSNRYAETGSPKEALPMMEQAVELFRKLAEDNFAAYGPPLALGLTNLGIRYGECGNGSKALLAFKEAAKIYRPLSEQNFAVYGPRLARILTLISVPFMGVLIREGELSSVEEAVSIYSKLRSENISFNHADFAHSLDIYSASLSRNGNKQQALDISIEAVKIYRKLAHDNHATHGPSLARSLANLSDRFSENNQSEEALLSIKESVEVLEPFSKDNSNAYGHVLTASYAVLSERLSKLADKYRGTGDRKNEIKAMNEMVELYQTLAKRDMAAYGPRLGKSLIDQALRLSKYGDSEGLWKAHDKLASLVCNTEFSKLPEYPGIAMDVKKMMDKVFLDIIES